ncbi:hypothetical protein FBEOM_14088 [Fusarium beomiforme]|uniref:Nucleoside phosphorylase domain-containing protein n=1 Tax=Fusarium beomiforme TaxID=44412 RepID=A0A9P5A4G3_9HYPO|nr:hypothetical protein FBEOM_14088 [Fusarium beomiforme]
MLDTTDRNAYTIGWVCALSTEFTAAKVHLDEEYAKHQRPKHREPNDYNHYAFGKIEDNNVVIAVLPKGLYGTASAAIVAKDMIRSFPNVRVGLMVGIAGGAPSQKHDVRLGDVVVSSPTSNRNHGGVFQYDFGKASNGAFQQRRSLNQPPLLLLSIVSGLECQHEIDGNSIDRGVTAVLDKNPRLKDKYGRPDTDLLFASHIQHNNHPCDTFCATDTADIIVRKPREEPEDSVHVHYGTIASADTLMKDPYKRDQLSLQEEVLCFETEAAGLMNGFPFLVIRGICDYSDAHKNDVWQGYAAMVAASYAKQVISNVGTEDIEKEETIISKMYEEKKEVLDWLSNIDFGAHHSDERKKQAPGTGQWLLKSDIYQSWVQKRGQILFCPGIAGAGKTVLASAIIENLHSHFQTDPGVAIAHIYCNYSRKNRQTVNALFASLLRQLCEKMPSIPPEIIELHEKCKPRGVEAPQDKVHQALESAVTVFSKVFIIVDALDEWQAIGQEEPYSLPIKLVSLQKKSGLNLLATSRPEPFIKMQFKYHPSVQITAQEEDIHAYVENFRWPASSCVAGKPIMQNLIKTTMSQVVEGMFLLANLYLHSLRDKTSPRDVREALEQFKDKAKKKDNNHEFDILGEVYKDTMERVKEQHPDHRSLAFRVLTWICCTNWELTTEAVQHGIALRGGDKELDADGIVDEKLLASVCCGLVEITEASGQLRLAHYTTEDFFQDNRHLLNHYFRDQHSMDPHFPPDVDTYISKQCVTCLSIGLNGLRYMRSRLRESGHYDWESEEEALEDLKLDLRFNPLYEYAVINWGNHVRNLSPLDQLDQTFIEFLRGEKMVRQAAEVISTFRRRSRREEPAPRFLNGLHLAAIFGLSGLAKLLIQDLDINSRDSTGRTALHWAVESIEYESDSSTKRYQVFGPVEVGRRCVVKALLQERADPNIPGPRGDTPLHLVASLGDGEVAELLLEYGAKVNISNQNGDIPLVVAVQFNKESIYKAFLQHDMAPDICGENGRTALIEAASVGNLILIQTLLARGAYIDFQDRRGQTALIEACKNGRRGVVELLLECNAQLHVQNCLKNTALVEASKNGLEGIVKLLLQKEAHCNVQNDYSNTTSTDDYERHRGGFFEQSIRQHTDKAVETTGHSIALVVASREGHLSIVSLLLEHMSHGPNSKIIETALSIACRERKQEVVEFLLNRYAKYAPYEWDYDKLRVIAVQAGHEGIFKLLSRDANYDELLVVAIEAGHENMFKFLLEAGASVKGGVEESTRLLYPAVSCGAASMVQYLIDAGADVNHPLEWCGLMPLELVIRERGEGSSIAEVLRKSGAISERERIRRMMLEYGPRSLSLKED